ncbi:MAG: DUF5694 domain-containing protein [Ekhidna sp.]|uniref:DUF5694 domain-containing protein n=1 Tax=Ekhidna sp. TaxID=2608089 RepID=UPI0032F07CFF
MKHAITILIMLLVLKLSAQSQINVTIIGTAHSFKKEYQPLQSFNEVQSFIKELSPDMICIEAIPTYDTASLKEIWPNTMRKADQLRDTLENITSDSEQVIVGAQYYSAYDFWNAYYHWFQAKQTEDSLRYFSKYFKDQSSSEFGLMVFPAAQKLGITHLYGIDFRDGEDEFMAANNKVLKKLFFSFKWKPLRVYLKTQKQYKKAEKAGELIEFINGAAFQDSFSALIDDLPKRLPKLEEAKFVKAYWHHRNEVMAERIIQTAQANDAQNVLLTVGSAHVTHIKQFLEKEGHQVTTYGQILNIKNQ